MNEALGASMSLAARPRVILWIAVGLTLVAATLVAAWQPLLGGIVVSAVACLGLLLRWPNLATFVVVFVIYSNVAVVAVRFHGVPEAAGVAVPLLLCFPLIQQVFIQRQPILLLPAVPSFLAFCLVQWLGVLFSKMPELAFGTFKDSLLEGFVLYMLMTNVVRARRVLWLATWALILAGCLMGGVPLYQQLTGTFDSDYGGLAQAGERGFLVEEGRADDEVRQPRLSGPIGEKNYYAQFLFMLIPLGFALASSELRMLPRLVAIAATLVSAVGMVLGFSRGVAVAFVLTLLVGAALGYVSRRQLGALVATGVFVLLLMPQYAVRLLSLNSALGLLRGDVVAARDDPAVTGRATEMIAALLVFLDHPVIGVGPGMFRYYSGEYDEVHGLRALEGTREAHSLYLHILAEHGVLGAIAFGAVLWLTIRDLSVTARANQLHDPMLSSLARGYLLSIIAFLASGLFLHFAFVRYFWLIAALSASLAHIGGNQQQIEPANPGAGSSQG